MISMEVLKALVEDLRLSTNKDIDTSAYDKIYLDVVEANIHDMTEAQISREDLEKIFEKSCVKITKPWYNINDYILKKVGK